jgi:hypothetical protein
MMAITFVYKGEFSPQEREFFAQSTEASEETLATGYLKVYTKDRIFTITAASDENLEAWYHHIETILQDVLGEKQFLYKQKQAQVAMLLFFISFLCFLALLCFFVNMFLKICLSSCLNLC